MPIKKLRKLFGANKYLLILPILALLPFLFFGIYKNVKQINPTETTGFNCPKSSPETRPPVECWEDAIKKSLVQNGIGGAFSLLDSIYKNDPGFGTNCHIFAHLIGYEAYRDFAKKNKFDFDITPASSLCGYGFYHGFLTMLVGKGKDITAARGFCLYIDNRLSKISPGAGENCFHGIGHGAATDPDKSLWGKAPALINQTAKICHSVSNNPNDQAPCYDGLFMGIADLYASNKYGFSIDNNVRVNPYFLCGNQSDELRDSCYGGMKLIVLVITNFDLAKSAKFVQSIPYEDAAKRAIAGLSGNIVFREVKNENHDKLFLTCKSLGQNLRLSCLEGIMRVLAQNSEFNDPKQPLSFCRNKIFTSEEKSSCYRTVFSGFKYIYPKEKVSEICNFVGEEYKKYCL